MGLIDPKTSDGRVIFFLPWEGNTIAGTTDVPLTEVTKYPVATEAEIQWILKEIENYLSPEIKVYNNDNKRFAVEMYWQLGLESDLLSAIPMQRTQLLLSVTILSMCRLLDF
jgi:hypothetical protein